jgi:hypothetical protein
MTENTTDATAGDEARLARIAREVDPNYPGDPTWTTGNDIRWLLARLAAAEQERDHYEKALGEVIDQRDAYETAVAGLDIATGGDGEYAYSTAGDTDDTAVKKCKSIAERFAAAEQARADAERELSRLTTPQPIGELHEDYGEVLCVHWDEHQTLGYWECNSLLSDGFDDSRFTHFYPLPKIQPPAAPTQPPATQAGEGK